MSETIGKSAQLFIDNKHIQQHPDDLCLELEIPSPVYHILLINNQLICNKALILKNNKVISTLDITDSSTLYNCFPENELVKISKFEFSVPEI